MDSVFVNTTNISTNIETAMLSTGRELLRGHLLKHILQICTRPIKLLETLTGKKLEDRLHVLVFALIPIGCKGGHSVG